MSEIQRTEETADKVMEILNSKELTPYHQHKAAIDTVLAIQEKQLDEDLSNYDINILEQKIKAQKKATMNCFRIAARIYKHIEDSGVYSQKDYPNFEMYLEREHELKYRSVRYMIDIHEKIVAKEIDLQPVAGQEDFFYTRYIPLLETVTNNKGIDDEIKKRITKKYIEKAKKLSKKDLKRWVTEELDRETGGDRNEFEGRARDQIIPNHDEVVSTPIAYTAKQEQANQILFKRPEEIENQKVAETVYRRPSPTVVSSGNPYVDSDYQNVGIVQETQSSQAPDLHFIPENPVLGAMKEVIEKVHSIRIEPRMPVAYVEIEEDVEELKRLAAELEAAGAEIYEKIKLVSKNYVDKYID